MNQRLIDYYLAEKGYAPDEIEDYKICADVIDPVTQEPSEANAAYIAAANPAAVLSLIAELEQAKKDAERYQWLRKSHHDDDSAIGVTREHMNGWGRIVGKSLRNSDLDKAIDEAIAKEQS